MESYVLIHAVKFRAVMSMNEPDLLVLILIRLRNTRLRGKKKSCRLILNSLIPFT